LSRKSESGEKSGIPIWDNQDLRLLHLGTNINQGGGVRREIPGKKRVTNTYRNQLYFRRKKDAAFGHDFFTPEIILKGDCPGYISMAS
jgi:hypothetical protein